MKLFKVSLGKGGERWCEIEFYWIKCSHKRVFDVAVIEKISDYNR